ncbi:Fis family two component sigma54 specific transcriptional regulator [Candidatus Nitrosoglobus terrae]|uniref:Fis family two component sigma54 specific transcriptional regulator n=1 Tax=Candidatus Nitrosoglobus terrae TaxID=1630141 RepID=A0A1Q2SN88_9GAMM|nr:PEP-CTERM-box response regulator transcription factor [Candidatus Nitrosoglobus terrae]BAW80608.1 Fis family two component sigma54 specific transcriptional regulator [Candidatus Nitrosoglobus terrae]
MSDKKNLLIVEDDLGLQKQLQWSFSDYEIATAEDRQGAIALVRRHELPVVTLDLGLPPDPGGVSEGMATLREILTIAPYTKIIVITGNDSREHAVRAVGAGAYDFYSKPIDPSTLKLIIDRAYQLYGLEMENRCLRADRFPLEGIIAVSPEMMKVCHTVEKIAPTDVTALILGESGTGKEVIARSLHKMSHRNNQAFLAINCAAIPENLLESELFGYEKGAFTGAVRQNRGKIEYADKGTLFLDEIGDLPQGLQAKLLRFLQERVIERVGGREEIPVNARVICATNQNLEKLISLDQFREDLYYRISEITITLPPLRKRLGDAVAIARVLLDRFAQTYSKAIRGFTDDAVTAIERYSWPGNVRELENCIKRVVVMAEGSRITAKDLGLSISVEQENLSLNLRQIREHSEREALSRAVAIVNGNLSRAAELLGITRPTLYALLDKYEMRS